MDVLVMYKENPNLITPPDDTVIRRYSDWPKFISLLTSRTLHFARSDRMEDPWEGWYLRYPDLDTPAVPVDPTKPKPSREELTQSAAIFQTAWNLLQAPAIPEAVRPKEHTGTLPAIHENMTQDELDATTDEMTKQFLGGLMEFLLNSMRLQTYLSCWHMDNADSLAMWRIYALQGQGIAIESTIGKLKAALASFSEDVVIGEVRYGSFDRNDLVKKFDGLSPFFVKREHFRYESEVRAVTNTKPPLDMDRTSVKAVVDLSTLIGAVVLAPNCETWYADQVAWLLDKAGLPQIPIKASPIAEAPNFAKVFPIREILKRPSV